MLDIVRHYTTKTTLSKAYLISIYDIFTLLLLTFQTLLNKKKLQNREVLLSPFSGEISKAKL